MGICGASAPNCTLWKQGLDPWEFKADPDIAGVGVSRTILYGMAHSAAPPEPPI